VTLIKKNVLWLAVFLLLLIPAGCSGAQPELTPGETTPPPPPSPVSSPEPNFPTGPIYTPGAAQYVPSGEQAEIVQYALDLINADRKSAGVNPVTLGYNAAAQKHAQDMFDNYFLAHWGTNGLKPYMRYTLEGGLDLEQENSAYSGWFNPDDDPKLHADIDPKLIINQLEHSMIYDDAKSNWGHRDAIINKMHKKVNIGLAYDGKRLALVQQFEGEYIEYIQPPVISESMLSLSGRLSAGTIKNILICFDELPQPLSAAQLVHGDYHAYRLPEREAYVIKPAPAGQFYKNLPQEAIEAFIWNTNESGQFYMQADISKALKHGKGVYTIVLVVEMGTETHNMTNYSIFVK